MPLIDLKCIVTTLNIEHLNIYTFVYFLRFCKGNKVSADLSASGRASGVISEEQMCATGSRIRLAINGFSCVSQNRHAALNKFQLKTFSVSTAPG